MIDRTRAATPWRTSAAVLLLIALAGCGSETGPSSEASAEPEPSFDVATATLTGEPFCDTLDKDLVGEVLGVPADELKVLEDRQVGERFEPVEEMGFEKSDANVCALGSSTSEFSVLVQPGANADEVQQAVNKLQTMQSTGESCDSPDAAAYGDPAGVLDCRSDDQVEGARFLATGLVGDSKFSCAVIVNAGAPEDLGAQATEACSTTLESLAAEGS